MQKHPIKAALRYIYITIFWQFFELYENLVSCKRYQQLFYQFVHFSCNFFWGHSIYFSIIFVKPKSIMFQKKIKLLDERIVSKNRWKRNEGIVTSQLPAILIFPNNGWDKQIPACNIFCYVVVKLFWQVKE